MLQQQEPSLPKKFAIEVNPAAIKATQAVVFSAHGAASIYTDVVFGQRQKVGAIKQSHLTLATIYTVDEVLLVQFERDIRYYFYGHYNFIEDLKKEGLEKQKIIVLAETSASSLESYDSDETAIRILARGLEVDAKHKKLKQAEFEGYFGELWSETTGRNVLVLLQVQTNYDLSLEVVRQFEVLKHYLPSLKADLDAEKVKTEIKIQQKSKHKDNVHI